jgi:hypothetical protein
VEANKELAFENSFITEGLLKRNFLSIPTDNEKRSYAEIADYIRANCPQNIRDEIIARGRGGLLEPVKQ